MLSDLIRNPQGTVANRIAVATELRYGAGKSTSRKFADRVDLVLNASNVYPPEPPADRIYVRIRHQLAQSGAPVGPNDLLVTAHAPALDLTVVTANEGELSRVSGLRVENWPST